LEFFRQKTGFFQLSSAHLKADVGHGRFLNKRKSDCFKWKNGECRIGFLTAQKALNVNLTALN
jgi:hypothetical protein